MAPLVTIYTDGSCLKNPGPGGYAALLLFKKDGELIEKVVKGGWLETTNNQMELMAAIKALQSLKTRCRVKLFSDSNYVVRGMKEWIHNWRRTKWKNGQLANLDLWKQLDELADKHSVTWLWVKAHAGHPENERVDELARKEAIKSSK